LRDGAATFRCFLDEGVHIRIERLAIIHVLPVSAYVTERRHGIFVASICGLAEPFRRLSPISFRAPTYLAEKT
jgi:hypothetical protein